MCSSTTNDANDSYDPHRNRWRTLYSHPRFKRDDFAIAVHEDRYILVIGGRNSMLEPRLCAMYDTQTHTCSDLPDLPEDIHQLRGAICNGYFYIVIYDNIYRMSLATRTEWKLVHTREIIYDGAVVSDGTNLYIFNIDNDVEIILYEPHKDFCTMISRLPTARSNFASVIIGGDIFVIGGSTGYRSYSSSMEVFNIPTRSWKTAPPLPQPLYGAAAAVIKDRWIVVTGGYHNYMTSSQSFIFDILSQEWTETERDVALSPARIGHSCVVIGSHVISVGGKDLSRNYCNMDVIHRKYLVPNWEQIKHFILLRKLVDDNRAHPMSHVNTEIGGDDDYDEDGATKQILDTKKVLEKFLTDLSLDVFRKVLSFLI